MKPRQAPHTVSGPGVEPRPADGSVHAAISLALTLASRHARDRREPGSFYVRDRDERTIARVDVEADGAALMLGPEQLAADAARSRPFVPGA